MARSRTLHSTHEDVIHDLSFDHFGKLLATCSSDRTIKIWKRDISNGEWKLVENVLIDDRKGGVLSGSGPVFRVRWASPMFGAVLGVANDSEVRVYEMVPSSTVSSRSSSSMFGGRPSESDGSAAKSQRMSMKKMKMRNSMSKMDLRVKDLGFCPVHFDGGLVLGCALKEGVIFLQRSIHEHTESEPFRWKRFDKYAHPDLHRLLPSSAKKTPSLMPSSLECQSLSWNQSRWEDPSFVVGYDHGQIAVFVFTLVSKAGKTGGSGSCSSSSHSTSSKRTSGTRGSGGRRSQSSLASAAGELSSKSMDKEWVCVTLLNVFEMEDKMEYRSNDINVRKLSSQECRVISIDWAAHLSRKEHRIACGCSDGLLRIIAMTRVSPSLLAIPAGLGDIGASDASSSADHSSGAPSSSLAIRARLEFQSKKGHSGRPIESVKWNNTGSLLCSACAGGRIVIWKRLVGGSVWSAIATSDSSGPLKMSSLLSESNPAEESAQDAEFRIDPESGFHILNRLVDLPTKITETYEDDHSQDQHTGGEGRGSAGAADDAAVGPRVHRQPPPKLADEDPGFYFD